MPYKYLILNKDLFLPNPLEELLDESIHLIITSPPYFNARNYRLHISTNGKADIRINARSKSQLETITQYNTYLDKMKYVINELYKKLKKGGIMALNVGSITSNGIRLPLPFHFFNLLSELFVWNETIIWDKT
ncbi:MAG: DNA methyltransferase, partial [Promethearchaeota archaeon]